MRIADMNWMMLEEYLKRDNRCVVPLGCTEQHAYLSLATDSILAERVSVEAAEPLGIPVFPALTYGITPRFRAYPGSIHLRVETYGKIVQDTLDSLYQSGFRRILVVNGHGGNTPAASVVSEWLADFEDVSVRFHNWWNAPKTWAAVQAIDPVASHASWMENFPWTRLPGVDLPDHQKPMVEMAAMSGVSTDEVRRVLGDGNFGGRQYRPDEDMMKIWRVAVEETRALLDPWEIR